MIVTHVSPDWDAIASVWLLKRFGDFEDHEVKFVNTGAPDPALLEAADAVVDTGRLYDVTRWRFDHHHLPGQEANNTSAAWMVWDWLHARAPIPSERFDTLVAIEPLIKLIFEGDTGRPGADWSRQLGLHAWLSGVKTKRIDDQIVLDFGCDMLDLVTLHLVAQEKARRTLAQHTVYRSDDGLLVALLNAPQGANTAAHEQGARLVLFYSEMPEVPTYARGMMRSGEGVAVHCGNLVDLVCADTIYGPASEAIVSELLTWYRHEAGFFAGRGTQKAPCTEPMIPDIRDIAKAIDQAWQR